MIAGFVWQVPARVLRWKDGDTCEVELDLGWRVSRHRETVRLLNLWCPELDEPGGLPATIRAYELAPPGTVVIVTSRAIGASALWTGAQESLSRTLGDLRLPDGRDFAEAMVAGGFGTRDKAVP